MAPATFLYTAGHPLVQPTANLIFLLQRHTFRRIIAPLFVMGGTCAILLLIAKVFLPGHHALQRALTP